MVFARREPFDPNRDFVCLTFFRAAGHAWERDAAFDKSTVDSRTLQRLYDNHRIGFKDYDEAQLAAELDPVTLEDAGNGSFNVNAPWLESPEKVAGRGAAVMRARAIRDAGEPMEHHGVAVVPTAGGWYSVNAAWLAAPEKIQGADKAAERAAELRTAGPPAGWVPAGTLAGSDSFQSDYTFGNEHVSLDAIVAAAQQASGHDAVVWNAMDQSTRDELIKAEIERRQRAVIVEEPPVEAQPGADSGGAA